MFVHIFLKKTIIVHYPILWASVSEPAGSVPTTQSQKREVGTIVLWPHARVCWMRVEREWKRVGLIDGWCGSECHGVVINNRQCQPMHPSLMCEEQSRVYQSRCVLACSTNFMVLMCAARCGHCARVPPLWEWTARHTASSTPHTPSHSITQHTPTNQHRHSSWCKQQWEGDWKKKAKMG